VRKRLQWPVVVRGMQRRVHQQNRWRRLVGGRRWKQRWVS
jgi:hypothetical protein